MFSLNRRPWLQALLFACVATLTLYIINLLKSCGASTIENTVHLPQVDRYWADFTAKLTDAGYQNIRQISTLPAQLLGPMNAVLVFSGPDSKPETYPKPITVGRISKDTVTFTETGTMAIDALFIGQKDNLDCTIIVATDAVFEVVDASIESDNSYPDARLRVRIMRANEPTVRLFLK